MRSNTKDKGNKSRSRDKINDSGLEKRTKNGKLTNDNQHTLDSTYRMDKSDLSEIYVTNNVKGHRKYESYNNFNSFLPKKEIYNNDTKSTINTQKNCSQNEITCLNNNDINKLIKTPNNPNNIPKSSKKKNEKKENSKDFRDIGEITPCKNESTKTNIHNNSNIILNQQGVPCYNNINIYTSGLASLKNGADCNLRNYIMNKVGHHKKSVSSSKLTCGQNKSSHHSKSNSTIGK